MTIRVSVKGRFVYNGKEYGSFEELPREAREACEKATAGTAPAATGGLPAAKARVVFNGIEYESPGAMPSEVRRLYEDAVAAVRSGHFLGVGTATPPGGGAAARGPDVAPVPVSAAPIGPGASGSRRTLIVLAAGLALVLALLIALLVSASAGR